LDTIIGKRTIKESKRSFVMGLGRASELGAHEAKLVDASSVVTAPWVGLKCRFGCAGYNTSLCFPPDFTDLSGNA
jgi:predicted metal-binding protein